MLQREVGTKIGFAILAVIFVICGGILVFAATRGDLKVVLENSIIGKKIGAEKLSGVVAEVKKFASADEFKKYLAEHAQQSNNYGFGIGGGEMRTMVAQDSAMGLAQPVGIGMAEKGSETATAPSAGRVSETNVQVAGIDEPDIVKTDGKEIYFSRFGGYYPYMRAVPMNGAAEKMIAPPYYNQGETKLIAAFPPESMKEDSKLDKSGDLLLDGNIMMVFASDNKIYAYDVKDKANPKELWTAKLGDRENLVGARLMNSKIYLTTQSGVDYGKPCPIVPLTVGKDEVSISCTDIYYPTSASGADVTYDFVVMDTLTGAVEKKTAFVGSSGQTVFYMSENAIYLTFQTEVDSVKVAYDFFSENKDLVPDWVIERLNKVKGYDLSMNAKQTELQSILQQYTNSLNNDDMLKMQNEMSNRMDKFYLNHRRDLDITGIVKISLNDFKAIAGAVPGHPLNQFSLDEYDKHLRVAMTVGDRWWGMGGFGGTGKTVSDVYVLDNDLNIVGSVKDLGETERIYSVRFLADRGYVVTFRETDPFYVLDLANPKNPLLRGELKIPGFSSYLHPLGAHKVLGIGREDGKVKLSIFDATSPENPKELSKYILSEYWSEAINNHHAFLLDEKHKVFFIPGGQGGYVFGYDKDELTLKKAVSESQVQRAIYLDDYMYLIGNDKITVLDEKSWEKVKEFELK
ncbi:MAG: beta-propeller domain-containing protein [Candidatus Magasanikbacteria bacterium]|nr:beta-propeller domain-containing protein [Candidatus Magasanikbacteria bacterium]